MNLIKPKIVNFRLLACIWAIWAFNVTQVTGQISTFPYVQDFETELQASTSCSTPYTIISTGWANDGANGTDWRADAGGTSSFNTGPAVDHNPGTSAGKYMYTETSGCSNRTAIMTTPVFDFTSAPAPQLSFWYHMFGATMGTLNFEVSTNNGATWTNLWNLSSDQGNQWSQAVINIAAYGGQSNIQFRFRGQTGTSFTSDMAIDNFLVENILPNNAGISAMTSPVGGAVAGSYPVDVILQNFGSNALNNVTIEWEINGAAQTPLNYTGPTVAAFANTSVNLSPSTAFASGITNMKFWTSLPNGVADSDNGNDTLFTIFCTGLSGTYTVGTPTSNFPTITDALNALNSCGMGGPVIMNVQAGTYNTPLVLTSSIPGLSATNTLTWDGSSQTALIQVAGGSAVTLDGADNITIRNFSINNSSTAASFGILLTNQADDNTIQGNRVTLASTNFASGAIVASASTTSATSNGNNANGNTVENNTIDGGYRGISFYGQTSGYNLNNTVRNNVISNCYYYGTYMYYQDGAIVDGNTISNMGNPTFHYGMYAYYTMNSNFTSNTVTVDDYGMYFGRTNSNTTPTDTALIANNMVISESDRAVYMYFTRATNIYHNTFKANQAAFQLSNTDNTINVKNNIFYSEADFAFESFSSTPIADMDYNAFFTPASNPNFISFSGTYTDLTDWQTNNPNSYGQNSQEGLPQFVSPTDLHLDGVFLNDMGVYVGVNTDIDGDTRPAAGAASVDIGADEYTPPNNDAGVSDLGSPTLPISGGFAVVEILVNNFGVQPLNSFMVEWEINGVAQAPVPYTGATIPVLGSAAMNLANINFPSTTTQLKFWTSMPNGAIDERQENDTLLIDICPGLQGTYTVGHSSSDFPTIADAVSALMNCGVSGPTEMEVQVGVYAGPLVLNEIPGASAVNTVTFNGVSPADVTITHNAVGVKGSATIALDGADYVIIENMTIVNNGVAPAYGVLLTNQANYNVILDNVIQVPYTAGITNVVGVLASNSYTTSIGAAAEGNNTNYTTIEGNTITGGTASIILEGGISDEENMNNSILNNDLSGADDYGIYVDEQDSLEISYNKVYNIIATSSDAVVCFDIQNFRMLGNEITSNDYGIAIDGGFSIGDRARNGLLANNMVEGLGTAAEAIYLRDVDQIQLYHNTLRGSPAIFMDNQSNVDVRNNIVSTTNDICIETPDPVSMAGMDYNLFYISGSGSAVRFGTTTYTTLANWQATGPAGYDANSVSGNPNFVNGLHVASNLPEDIATTTGLTYATNVDFDGDARPLGAGHDIGADEKVTIAVDAMSVGVVSPSVCGSTNSDVIITIANAGANGLVNIPVTVNVTGAATQTFSITHPLLAAGISTDINVGTLNTSAGGTYNFQIIVNATGDLNGTNDTVNVSVTLAPDNINALTNIGDTIVCQGDSAMIKLTSSVAGVPILWYNPLGFFLASGDEYNTPALTTNITYFAQLQGCNAPRKPVTIQVDAVGIAVDLGPDSTTICDGDAVEIIPTITLATAETVTWSNGALSSFIEATSAGNYSIIVESASGCTATDSIEVLTVVAPSISGVGTNPTCGGANDGTVDLTLSGSGSYSFDWSNGSTNEDLSNIGGGVYVVSITDNSTALGCEYTANFTLTEPAILTSNINSTTISCNGNDGTISMSVAGGLSPYSYAWSNNATNQNLTGLPGGNYTVTITDGNNCQTTLAATVATANPIVASVDSIYAEILSVAGSIDIAATGGSGNLQYVWSNGQTTQDATNLSAGTYSVTIVDAVTGCQTVLSGLVVAYQIPDMVGQIDNVQSFNLYPNPTTDKVFVNIVLSKVADVQLEITSITGQKLQSFAPRQDLDQLYEIDMADYPAGVYLARFIVGNKVSTAKIIVARN